MPVGNAYATGNIIAYIEQYHLQNKRLNVLDVGCGIGHNGFIFREMFEIRYMRLMPKQWMHRVEAIEIFRDYKNPVWGYVYDKVLIGDCMKAVPRLEDKKYDIIFATEILEHFAKDTVYNLIDSLIEKIKAGGSIIITVPVGDEDLLMAQKSVFGNKHEEHRSSLTIDDFEGYHIRHKVNDGIFMIGKKDGWDK